MKMGSDIHRSIHLLIFCTGQRSKVTIKLWIHAPVKDGEDAFHFFQFFNSSLYGLAFFGYVHNAASFRLVCSVPLCICTSTAVSSLRISYFISGWPYTLTI